MAITRGVMYEKSKWREEGVEGGERTDDDDEPPPQSDAKPSPDPLLEETEALLLLPRVMPGSEESVSQSEEAISLAHVDDTTLILYF